MSLARYERTLVDEAGNILSSATITVRHEATGSALATLYSDREGTTPMANPFSIGSSDNGLAAFHVIGGAYRIDVVSGGLTRTRRYQGIGTGSEIDANAFLSAGWQFQVEGDNTAPPSAGCVRFDNDDLSLATKAWFDYATAAGASIPGIIQELDPGAKATKNTMILVSQADGTQVSWTVDAVVDHTTYKEVDLTSGSHQGVDALTSATPVNLQREISGDIAGTGNDVVITTAGTTVVGNTDGKIIVKLGSAGSVTLTLGKAADRNSLPLIIADFGGNATITVNCDAADTGGIMGSTSMTMASSGTGVGQAASTTIYPKASLNGWFTA